MVMAFGKYAGYHIHEIPTSYLLWVFEHTRDNISSEVIDAIREEIFMRLNIKTIELDGCNNLNVKRIYKELATRYHPDKGGSNEAMQALNEFYEKIKNL